jgi:hypothetical protein
MSGFERSLANRKADTRAERTPAHNDEVRIRGTDDRPLVASHSSHERTRLALVLLAVVIDLVALVLILIFNPHPAMAVAIVPLTGAIAWQSRLLVGSAG